MKSKKQLAIVTLFCILFTNIATGFTVEAAPGYIMDGTFEKNVVQNKTAGRAEQKASYSISIGNSQGYLFPSQPNFIKVDGYYIHFSGGNNDETIVNGYPGIYVKTTDYGTTGAANAAARLGSLITGFTGASGVVYDVSVSGTTITITTHGAETKNGENVPIDIMMMNYTTQNFTPGYSYIASSPEIVDFTPKNVSSSEIYELTLSGTVYTATGTSVSNVVSNLVSAVNNNPSPNGTCVDNNTSKITCTSTDFNTSLNSSSRVIYTTPDSRAPLITLSGPSTVNLNYGDAYTDSGATWQDNRDGTGTLTASNIGGFSTSHTGTYVLTYNKTDAAGNTGTTVSRSVTVTDSDAPVVTVLGSGSVTHELDLAYTDSGAIWTDNADGSGSLTAINLSSLSSTGTHTLNYIKTDSSGNVGTGSRVITIVDTIAPSLNITTTSTTVNSNYYLVKGTTGIGAVNVNISGGSGSSLNVSIVNNSFSALVPLIQNTTNNLLITVNDASANTSTGSVAIVENSGTSSFGSPLSSSGGTLALVTTASGTLTNASSIQINTPIFFVTSSGTITIPSDTQIVTSSGTNFNASLINALNVTVSGGLSDSELSNGAIEFGISNIGLNFSKPIKVQIPVSSFTGTTIPVKVKHGGTSTYGTTGLTNDENATCNNGIPSVSSNIATVSAGVATIYTCSASTFTTITNTPTVTNSNGGNGGGSSFGGVSFIGTKTNTGTTTNSGTITIGNDKSYLEQYSKAKTELNKNKIGKKYITKFDNFLKNVKLTKAKAKNLVEKIISIKNNLAKSKGDKTTVNYVLDYLEAKVYFLYLR